MSGIFKKDEPTVKPFNGGATNRKPALGYINQDLIDKNGGKHKLRGMPMYGDTYVEKQVIKAATAYYEEQNALFDAGTIESVVPFTITTEVTVQLVLTDEARGDISF